MPYPTKKLSQICKFQNWFAFKSNLFKENWLPILRISNIQDNNLSYNRLVFFDKNDYNKDLSNYIVSNWDLVIAMSWATTWKLAINNTDEDFYLNQRVWKFIFKDDISKKYTHYFLWTKIQENLKQSVWSAIPNLSTEQINNIEIPFPDLKTQTQIVQKLDSSFEKIDKSIKKVKEDLENLEELNKSSLNNFWDFDKVFIWDVVEKLFAWWDLPKDKSFSKEETDDYKIPIYANAIKKDWLYWYTHTAKVFEDCITISARWTIWFTKIRTIPFYPIVRLLVLIPKKEIADIKYLEYIINTINLKQFWSSIPQLSVPQLKNFKIPLPPLKTQKQIVQKLDKIFDKNKILKEKYQNKLKNLEEMKQSLLKEAFENEDFV